MSCVMTKHDLAGMATMGKPGVVCRRNVQCAALTELSMAWPAHIGPGCTRTPKPCTLQPFTSGSHIRLSSSATRTRQQAALSQTLLQSQQSPRQCLASQRTVQHTCRRRQQLKLMQSMSKADSTGRHGGQRRSTVAQSIQAPERADATGTAGPSGPSTSVNGPATWMTDVRLPQYSTAMGKVELVIAGAGPSGLAVADRVSQAGTPEPPPKGMHAAATPC